MSLVDDIYGAVDEAAAELEAGVAEDGASDAEPEADEAAEAAQDDLDEDEEVASEETGDAEPEPSEGGPDWDRLDELPNEVLPPKVAKLRQDRDRMASEVGEMRKRLAALEAQAQAAVKEPEPKIEDDPRPPRITADDTPEEIEAKVEALAEWKTRQALKGIEAKMKAQEESEERAQQERAQSFFMEQSKRIESSEGYSEAVGKAMAQIAQSNQGWYDGLATPEGWDELFKYARFKVEAADGFKYKSTKMATAKNREVPRKPVSAKKVEPDVDLAGMSSVEEKVHAIMDDLLK